MSSGFLAEEELPPQSAADAGRLEFEVARHEGMKVESGGQ